MKYLNLHGQYHVKVGAYIDPLYFPYLSYLFRDAVTNVMRNTTLDLGWFPVESTVGMYSDRGDAEVTQIGTSKPPTIPYDSAIDARRYASIMDGVAAAGRILRGGDTIIMFRPDTEKQTVHASYRGTVGAMLADDLLQDTGNVENTQPITYGNVYTPSYVPDGFNQGWWLRNFVATPDLLGFNYSLGEDHFDWAPRRDLLTTLQWLVDQGEYRVGQFNGGSDNWLSVCDNFHLTVTPTHISFTYHWYFAVGARRYDLFPYAEGSDAVFSMESDAWKRYELSVEPPSISGYMTEGTHSILPFTGFGMSAGYDNIQYIPNNVGWDTAQGGSISWETSETTFLYLSRIVQSDGTGIKPDFDSFAKRPYLRVFRDEVQDRASDIRFSSYQSTVDALNTITTTVNNNVLQSLSKAGQLSALMPEVKSALSGVLHLARGEPISSFLDLIDFVTALRLQTAFVYRPDLDFLAKVLPEMLSLLKSLDDVTNEGDIIARGVFHYDFPLWEFKREKSTLVTRSRVACSRDVSPLLKEMLNVSALGVLPSASNIWDLIPFSFVVNWFSGIGTRLRDFESIMNITLMGLEVITHTYTVDSVLTVDELSRDQIAIRDQSGSEDPPRLRFFAREVSAHIPKIGQGRYDFRLPGRPPDLLTAGSLAWQLIASR